MSRVIKFRAWDEERKCFRNDEFLISTSSKGAIQVVGISIDSDAETIDEDIVLDQFTGLHDKNGKEIYEGDIVSFTQTYIAPCAVYWNKEMTGFYPLISERSKNLTVIGNIHENPELLK